MSFIGYVHPETFKAMLKSELHWSDERISKFMSEVAAAGEEGLPNPFSLDAEPSFAD